MTIRRALPWILGVAVVITALALASLPGGSDDSVEARVERISTHLRCPTCQNLSVGASPSSTARAIRDDVHRRVVEGETDEEIKQAYVDRYGEWVLLRPTSDGIAVVVWALPVVVLVSAVGGLALAFRRWKREPEMQATSADHELVARALARDAGEGADPTAETDDREPPVGGDGS